MIVRDYFALTIHEIMSYLVNQSMSLHVTPCSRQFRLFMTFECDGIAAICERGCRWRAGSGHRGRRRRTTPLKPRNRYAMLAPAGAYTVNNVVF